MPLLNKSSATVDLSALAEVASVEQKAAIPTPTNTRKYVLPDELIFLSKDHSRVYFFRDDVPVVVAVVVGAAVRTLVGAAVRAAVGVGAAEIGAVVAAAAEVAAIAGFTSVGFSSAGGVGSARDATGTTSMLEFVTAVAAGAGFGGDAVELLRRAKNAPRPRVRAATHPPATKSHAGLEWAGLGNVAAADIVVDSGICPRRVVPPAPIIAGAAGIAEFGSAVMACAGYAIDASEPMEAIEARPGGPLPKAIASSWTAAEAVGNRCLGSNAVARANQPSNDGAKRTPCAAARTDAGSAMP
jgi:hypothetical protein